MGPEPPESQKEGVSLARLPRKLGGHGSWSLSLWPSCWGQRWGASWRVAGGSSGTPRDLLHQAGGGSRCPGPQALGWWCHYRHYGGDVGLGELPQHLPGPEAGLFPQRHLLCPPSTAVLTAGQPSGLALTTPRLAWAWPTDASQTPLQPAQKLGRLAGAPGHPPPWAHPHSPLSPCGQPRHAPRARRRLPTHGKAKGGGRVSAWPTQAGGWGVRAGGTYRDAGLSRGAGLAQLSSSALHGKEGRVPAQDPGWPLPRPPTGEGSHLPVLPSHPWTLLVPGDPAGQRAGVRATASMESTPKGRGALAAALARARKPHSGTRRRSPVPGAPSGPVPGAPAGLGTHRQPVGPLLSWGAVATSVTLREIRG